MTLLNLFFFLLYWMHSRMDIHLIYKNIKKKKTKFFLSTYRFALCFKSSTILCIIFPGDCINDYRVHHKLVHQFSWYYIILECSKYSVVVSNRGMIFYFIFHLSVDINFSPGGCNLSSLQIYILWYTGHYGLYAGMYELC